MNRLLLSICVLIALQAAYGIDSAPAMTCPSGKKSFGKLFNTSVRVATKADEVVKKILKLLKKPFGNFAQKLEDKVISPIRRYTGLVRAQWPTGTVLHRSHPSIPVKMDSQKYMMLTLRDKYSLVVNNCYKTAPGTYFFLGSIALPIPWINSLEGVGFSVENGLSHKLEEMWTGGSNVRRKIMMEADAWVAAKTLSPQSLLPSWTKNYMDFGGADVQVYLNLAGGMSKFPKFDWKSFQMAVSGKMDLTLKIPNFGDFLSMGLLKTNFYLDVNSSGKFEVAVNGHWTPRSSSSGKRSLTDNALDKLMAFIKKRPSFGAITAQIYMTRTQGVGVRFQAGVSWFAAEVVSKAYLKKESSGNVHMENTLALRSTAFKALYCSTRKTYAETVTVIKKHTNTLEDERKKIVSAVSTDTSTLNSKLADWNRTCKRACGTSTQRMQTTIFGTRCTTETTCSGSWFSKRKCQVSNMLVGGACGLVKPVVRGACTVACGTLSKATQVLTVVVRVMNWLNDKAKAIGRLVKNVLATKIPLPSQATIRGKLSLARRPLTLNGAMKMSLYYKEGPSSDETVAQFQSDSACRASAPSPLESISTVVPRGYKEVSFTYDFSWNIAATIKAIITAVVKKPVAWLKEQLGHIKGYTSLIKKKLDQHRRSQRASSSWWPFGKRDENDEKKSADSNEESSSVYDEYLLMREADEIMELAEPEEEELSVDKIAHEVFDE